MTTHGSPLAAGKQLYQWTRQERWEESSLFNFVEWWWRDEAPHNITGHRGVSGSAGKSLQACEREPKGRHLDERYGKTRTAEELSQSIGGAAKQQQRPDQLIVRACQGRQPFGRESNPDTYEW